MKFLYPNFSFSLFLAVQKERDRLGRQRHHNYPYRIATIKPLGHLNVDYDDDEDDLSIMALLRAEQTAKEVRGYLKLG
jgi:hypothetical protein